MNCRVSVVISLSVLLLGVASAVADSFVLDSASPTMGGAPDVLNDPGPTIGLGLAALGLVPGDRIDALSFGDDPLNVLVHGPHDHLFSVSRATSGDSGTGVEAERLSDTAPPGGVSGHPADIFLHIHGSAGNVLAPASTGLGWSASGGDEDNAGLVTTVITPPGDDVVAYELFTMSSGGTPPFEVYFSLAPGSPTLGVLLAGPADILAVGGAFGAGPVIFATEASLLIAPGPGSIVDIDALSLEVAPGVPAPTLVRAQFSVTSASATGWTTSNGDIVDSGALVILYDPSVPVSLVAHTPVELGLLANDELDALEATFYSPPPPAPPGFDFQALPELTGGASRALGFGGHDIGDAVVVGEAREAQGNWRAVVWEDTGSGYQASVLPAIDPTRNSRANDITADVPIACVVGASENNAGILIPVVWDGQVGGSWTMTELPRLGGQEGEPFRIGSSGEDGVDLVFGWAAAQGGRMQAVVWVPQPAGNSSAGGAPWVLYGTPQPCFNPTGDCWSNDGVALKAACCHSQPPECVWTTMKRCQEVYAGTWYLGCDCTTADCGSQDPCIYEMGDIPVFFVVGGSVDGFGRTRPVLWQELPVGGFEVIELPLLDGDQGEATAIDCSQTAACTVVGWSNVAGGNRHAVRWEFADGQWVVEDIGNLQGFVNSRANSLVGRFYADENGLTIAGVSDNGPGLDVATIWMTSGGPAVTTDLNELVTLPQTVVLREATVVELGGQEGEDIVIIGGSFTAGVGRGPTDPHAFILTEQVAGGDIPTVSEWGMVAMTLLLLTVGTLVLTRRGSGLSTNRAR